jgi:4-aminobutyrate aminotransferase-like enzyme
MATQERTASDAVVAARERYVAAGVATPLLVVARAEGALIEDVDGRTYIDFAGGLGCQNTGHGLPAAVDAIHEQVDRYLHQCFMVGMYEPYIDVCRRLSELSPCRGEEQKSLLVNSGAEGVENAVKIARVATGRPAVVAFDRAFHGRTLLTMALTSKVVPYKRGFGPFAPEVYRAPAPYPYRGVSTDDAIHGLEALFKSDVDPESVACVVLEPVQGEGGFLPMPLDFPPRLRELCDRHGILYVDDEVQSGVGRTGPVWAIEHYGVEPDLLVSGKSLGGGNPVACVAAVAVLDEVVTETFQRRAGELGERVREALDGIASRVDAVGEVRGLGPMLALELVEDRETKAPAAALAGATVAAARERGLVLLSCGLYGNVVRILVPLVIGDDDLDRGLELLEESLVAASASA